MLDHHHEAMTPCEPWAPDPTHSGPTAGMATAGGRASEHAAAEAPGPPYWVDGLAPPRLNPLERALARSPAMQAGDDGSLIAAIRRVRAWVDHPGPDLDPFVRDGMDCANIGLTLLHATRRATTSLNLEFREESGSAFRRRRDVLVVPAVSLCIGLDLAESTCRRVGAGRHPRADDGGGRLPCPSSARLFGRLGRLWRDRGALTRAVARYRSVREAYGLGVGLDPDLVTGVGHASDMLVLLLAIRPATTPGEGRAKAATVAGHPRRRADHVGAVLDMCLAHDRAVLGATP